MVCHFICNIWLIGRNIFKWLNRQVEKLWVTVCIVLHSTNQCAVFFLMSFLLLCRIVMGKAEGHGENWHGHVTALTVSPDYRRLGLAGTLMRFLENVSEK